MVKDTEEFLIPDSCLFPKAESEFDPRLLAQANTNTKSEKKPPKPTKQNHKKTPNNKQTHQSRPTPTHQENAYTHPPPDNVISKEQGYSMLSCPTIS